MALYIHIGTHKTGTTAIQSALYANRSALAKRGYLYPRACSSHYAQHRLSFSLKGMKDPSRGDVPEFSTEIEDILAEIKNKKYDDIIISSEEFFSISRNSIKKLYDKIEHFNPIIIAYIRHPVDIFASLYNQRVKDFQDEFKLHITNALKTPRAYFPHMSYLKNISNWADQFGHENMKIVQYENGDVIEQFLKIIGYTDPLTVQPIFTNKSINSKTLEMIRLSKHLTTDLRVRKLISKIAYDKFRSRSDTIKLSATDQVSLLNEYEEDNNTLFSKFTGIQNPYNHNNIIEKYTNGVNVLNSMELMEIILDQIKSNNLPYFSLNGSK